MDIEIWGVWGCMQLSSSLSVLLSPKYTQCRWMQSEVSWASGTGVGGLSPSAHPHAVGRCHPREPIRAMDLPPTCSLSGTVVSGQSHFSSIFLHSEQPKRTRQKPSTLPSHKASPPPPCVGQDSHNAPRFMKSGPPAPDEKSGKTTGQESRQDRRGPSLENNLPQPWP